MESNFVLPYSVAEQGWCEVASKTLFQKELLSCKANLLNSPVLTSGQRGWTNEALTTNGTHRTASAPARLRRL